MTSEFASLLSLAISQGFSQSDLIVQIRKDVLAALRDQFPKSPIDASVVIDEASGAVRIFSSGQDVTPTKFAPLAAQIARQTLIAAMAQSPSPATSTPTAGPGGTVSSLLANLFFWGYNLYFLLISLIFSLSYVFSRLSWESLKSLGLFRFLVIFTLLATSAVSIYVAVKNHLSRSPGQLLRLFFLLELPLVLACLVPLVLLPQTTPFLILVVLALLCLPAVFYFYQYQSPARLSPSQLKLLLLVQQFVFMLGAYLVFLFSFYVPVILGSLAEPFLGRSIAFPTIYSLVPPVPDLSSLLWGAFFLLVVIALTILPLVLLAALWKALSQARLGLKSFLGDEQILSLQAVYAVIIFSVGFAAAYQPAGSRLLSSLANVSTVSTFTQKEQIAKELTSQKDTLKKLITNIELARYKYFWRRDDTGLQREYERVFNLAPTSSALIQKTFLAAAYPFVYQGEVSSSYQLAQNYQYLFGENPYQTTPAPTPTAAKNVLLSARKVTLSPHSSGLLANITIEEEYDNQTYQQQEVIYEFALTGAVMTDLKLGPNLEFPGIIAPKGAAQRTYEQQLQIRRDPALLEETGPRQYRLRIFPVPAKNDAVTLKGRRQKVAYSYTALATPEGFPLPQITRQTNVFTSPATRFLGVKSGDKFLPSPRSVCAGSLVDISPLKNLDCTFDTTNITGLKIGVFVNVSAEAQKIELADLLKDLDAGLLARNSVDFYRYNDLLSPKSSSLDEVTASPRFGRSQGLAALAEVSQRYDLVLILTAADRFTEADSLPFSPPTRVYLVHSGNPPPYHMKLTSQLLQTGGDAVSSISEALRLFAAAKDSANHVVSPYFSAPASSSLTAQTGALAPVLNQAIYRSYLTTIPTEVSGDISQLDRLHQFAKSANITTPYSSFIALVNQQQRELLEQQSQGYNRYQDQPLTESQPLLPRPVGPAFMRSFSSPLFGVDILSLDLPKTAGGSGGVVGFAAADGGGISTVTVILLVLITFVPALLGLGYYLLLHLLRRRPQTT